MPNKYPNKAVAIEKKPEQEREVKREGTDIKISRYEMELISQNIMTQAKAMTVLADELKALKKDREDMGAMISYLSENISKISDKVDYLVKELG
jgi:translation initiation factor 2 beta subunit (eIF-2beta)/eIF-5